MQCGSGMEEYEFTWQNVQWMFWFQVLMGIKIERRDIEYMGTVGSLCATMSSDGR